MDRELDIKMKEVLKVYFASEVEDQVDYKKFHLYSIPNSTAIESSTVTEIEYHFLFIKCIAVKGRSLTEQIMNVNL